MTYYEDYIAFIDAELAADNSEFWDYIIYCYVVCMKIKADLKEGEARFLNSISHGNAAVKKELDEKQVFCELVAGKSSWMQLKNLFDGTERKIAFARKLFGILDAFDSAVEQWFTHAIMDKVGPFGKEDGPYRLYVTETGLNRKAANAFEYSFPANQTVSFGYYFKHLIFWNSRRVIDDRLVVAPQAPLIRLASDDGAVRIAMLPFDHALMKNKGGAAEAFLGYDKTDIGEFYWYHTTTGKERVLNKYKELLKTVVEKQDPDIIVFPEYCFHEGFSSEISNLLRDFEDVRLKVVIAGTAWVNEVSGEETLRNNICKVFLKDADVVLDSYKVQSFVKREDSVIELFEAITNPGKSIVLPYLKGVGFVQILVCKDLIDFGEEPHIVDEYTERFFPSVVIVPAFSSSTSAFITPIERLMNKCLACVAVCNCCTWAKNDTVGLCAVPAKHTSVHNAYTPKVSVLKCKCGVIKKRAKCPENCSCGKLYVIDYSQLPPWNTACSVKDKTPICLDDKEFEYSV